MKMRYQLYLAALIFLFANCKETSNSTEVKLGEAYMDVSCTEEAKEQFLKGLLYLHSFEYVESRNAFLKVQELDPLCGMAVWGELMGYNQVLFNQEFLGLARSAATKFGFKGATDKRLPSQLEKDLFRSVEILYAPGDKSTRNSSYSKYMKKLYQKYPDNHEVAAFYALF